MSPMSAFRRDCPLASMLATLVFCTAFAVPWSANAAVIPVTNCNDSGPGSFRDAVASAVDGDTLDASVTPFCAIRITSEVVVPQDNLAIRGRSGNPVIIETFIRTSRLIRHTGTGTLSFFGVALDSGRVAGPIAMGGCVLSNGHVDLDTSQVEFCEAIAEGEGSMALGGGIHARSVHAHNTRFDNNRAVGDNSSGGAISSEGRVTLLLATLGGNDANYGGAVSSLGGATVTYSFILSNRAWRDNGGMQVSGGSVTVNKSLIDSNVAGRRCGGLCVAGTGRTSVLDSTISRNRAPFLGAGELSDDATVSNSTIAYNTDTSGSECVGVIRARRLRLESTIIASNACQAAGQTAYDVGGRAWEGYTIAGHDNLVGRSRVPVPADTISADPMLAPIAQNGGVSSTFALMPGSPAIDHGNNVFNRLYDQRGPGFPRVVGSNADIGAFEVQLPE